MYAANEPNLLWDPLVEPQFLMAYILTSGPVRYSKGMDQPGKAANPARGQLNREL